MVKIFVKFLCLIFSILFIVIVAPVSATDMGQTPVTVSVSGVYITTDDVVQNVGYFVNDKTRVTWIPISTSGDTISIRLSSLPYGKLLKTVVDDGEVRELIGHPVTITVEPHTEPMSIRIHLSLIDDPNAPPKNPFSGIIPSIIPNEPEQPEDPENPDTPGSDEPYRPILPPAGFVYNIAGFIPLAAGFLLLFLLFAFRGNLVYRILRKQAKKNGHKPEKETLKATAAGVVALIRNEELYPEWRKNSETTARLTADISRVLDETQYPAEIPRGIVVARIIKAAKGRINRHRL